eukprot:TRINITY_DN28008_c0_g1_i4.p3 TRINITY_DN28008_c0_g1~~TRINITY_DN28008_c0_g1_i4.p3  ORF type:complete len:148 (-),score=6.53 TRINITY_DN28008_c0_g1_i4:227-670(-)
MSEQFSTGLLDCWSDIPVCVYGMFCSPCVLGYNYSQATGESGKAVCASYCIQHTCCSCAIVGASVRKQLRCKYNLINEDYETWINTPIKKLNFQHRQQFGDCCLHCFCGPCSICQEARQVKVKIQQQQMKVLPNRIEKSDSVNEIDY